ncbi:uncharacterized protein V3H86_003446 [Mergus octosetaceus]
MAGSNCTPVTTFSLTGLTNDPGAQAALFLLFLLIYIVTILANLGMLPLIMASPRLHTPMYYFLGNLAFVDLCSSTTIAPKMLADFLLEKKRVTYAGCVAQVLVFDILGVTEGFLLAMMAYDRYVAICHPLLYSVTMSPKCCFQLVTCSYLMGLMNGVGQTIGMLRLSFCSSSVIDHFFCDISPLISLSTSDTTLNQIMLRTLASLFGVSSSLVVLLSYIAIISTILSIRSAEGKCKAFSTCASHLAVVSIFYGTSIFMYLKASSRDDKRAAVLYTMVTPMLNPLIYSLRNQEVKEALRRLTKMKRSCMLYIAAAALLSGGPHWGFNCGKFTLENLSLSSFLGPSEKPVGLLLVVSRQRNLELQLALFMAFLVVYLMTLLGNLGMIILIRTSPQLYSPMYYFLGNLALVDFLYSTVVTPKLLADLVRQKPLSYVGCVTQVFVFSVFLVTECFLLATMAYDRYMAVSHPLHYSVLMSPRLCAQLVGGSYLAGLVNGMGQTIGMFNLSFCGSVVVNLFFCDLSLLVSLSSSDSTLTSLIMTVPTFLFGVSSSLIVLVSYIAIVSTILSIRSAEGKCKAFSTCASHLTTVSIFYGNGLFVYLKPSSLKSREEDKWVAVLYTVVTPMLNPLIYSLRNQDVKEALRRLRARKRT